MIRVATVLAPLVLGALSAGAGAYIAYGVVMGDPMDPFALIPAAIAVASLAALVQIVRGARHRLSVWPLRAMPVLLVVGAVGGGAAVLDARGRARAREGNRFVSTCREALGHRRSAMDLCIPAARQCASEGADPAAAKACLEERLRTFESIGVLEPRGGSRRPNEVTPVYPRKVGAVPPLVERLCDVLHGLPKRREAECCGRTPGVILTSECVRNLAGAVTSSAAELSAEDVDACATAMEKAHEGCDWVGPYPPTVPGACLDIIRGRRAIGDVCRSALECADGLRCVGSGPTDPGRCGPPSPIGSLCNTAVDPLVVYARQDDVDVRRPACAGGFCDRNRCRPHQARGERCSANAHCGGGRCADGVCVEESVAPLGGPCLGGDCPAGARCTRSRCVEAKPIGATCASDAECKAACVEGRCKMGCEIAPMLKVLSPSMKGKR
jgi:hypothetical protein